TAFVTNCFCGFLGNSRPCVGPSANPIFSRRGLSPPPRPGPKSWAGAPEADPPPHCVCPGVPRDAIAPPPIQKFLGRRVFFRAWTPLGATTRFDRLNGCVETFRNTEI